MARFTLPRDVYFGQGTLEELKNLGMSREELLQLWEGEKSSC